MAAEQAAEAADATAEIAEAEISAKDEAAAARNSATEAAAAVDAAEAAAKTAAAKAEKASSEEDAAAAIAASMAAKVAAEETVAAANKAVAAAKDARSKHAAAKTIAADIAFFKDADAGEDQEEPAVDENKMVIVDVVIIRTEEDNTTSKGVNLLSGLTLQFGGGLVTTSAYGVSDINVIPSAGGVTRTITRAINIPSITYSLNIANAATERNEILARPTLVALAGEQSEFFSGIKIQASAIGGASDTGSTVSIEDEIGVRLKVTPEFLEDGRIKLSVEAERTFLATPNTTSITYEFRVDTSKTNVSANVVMNFGETLILSGLSEKETERVSTGVPLLQDIPGLQYFFSNRTTRDFQKSVLILLTPRPPNYVHQSEKDKKQSRRGMGRDERVLSELQARYSDWFKPYPNWASVFNHLQANSLYREFRTGDVAMEKWENQKGYKGRLRKAMEFLYH
jgi:Flp pilus assembly secretin CpaC